MKPLGLIPAPRRPVNLLIWAMIALGIWLIITPTVLRTGGTMANSERMAGFLVLMMTTMIS